MSVKTHWRSGGLFFFANVVSGGLHYLFQVVATRQLSAEQFADLNGWFAHLALFFLVGGMLQYSSNFIPFRGRQLRRAIVFINALAVFLVVAWWMGQNGQTFERAAMIWVGASLFGWLNGQAQGRLMFGTLSIVNLLVAASKLALVLIPGWTVPLMERFTFAFFSCYLPGLWWISVDLWSSKVPPVAAVPSQPWDWKLWQAPLALSVATAVVPQMDLVLTSHLQTALVFQEFARASLFFRAVFFLFFIFAQWILPLQIRAGGQTGSLAPTWLVALIVGFAGVLTLLAPKLAQYGLHWDQVPHWQVIFLSCLNMGLLAWMFMIVQTACAQKRMGLAGAALLGLGVECVLQIGLHLELDGYLLLAVTTQATLITLLLRGGRWAFAKPNLAT